MSNASIPSHWVQLFVIIGPVSAGGPVTKRGVFKSFDYCCWVLDSALAVSSVLSGVFFSDLAIIITLVNILKKFCYTHKNSFFFNFFVSTSKTKSIILNARVKCNINSSSFSGVYINSLRVFAAITTSFRASRHLTLFEINKQPPKLWSVSVFFLSYLSDYRKLFHNFGFIVSLHQTD